ncbi:MAG: cell division protein FtsQ/DivIB [Terriglobia bacterium]
MQEPKVGPGEHVEHRVAVVKRLLRRYPYVFLAPLGGLLAVLFLLVVRPVFLEVARVNVVGNAHFTSGQIREVAKAPTEASFFSFPSRRVRANLLAESRIRTVTVKRDFPSTVVITVAERRPIARVKHEGTWILIDGEAVVLGPGRGAAAQALPRIERLRVADLPEGKQVRTASLDNALKALSSLDKDLKRVVRSVRAGSVDEMMLITEEGIEILYGEADKVEQKNYVLKKILAGKTDNIIYVDLRVYTNPVVKRLGKGG